MRGLWPRVPRVNGWHANRNQDSWHAIASFVLIQIKARLDSSVLTGHIPSANKGKVSCEPA